MRNPVQVVLGGVVALFGAVFFFQGIGVIHGSSMTGTVTWSVLGPIIFLVGAAVAVRGLRKAPHP
jgi:hypothetical protein